MFLNLLRFLLLILVFDSTLSENAIPPKNQNSLEDPSFNDNYEKLEKHEFRSEKPTYLNGKSTKGNSNGEETKNLSENEFLTLEDSNDNFLKLKPNPVISKSERNEKTNGGAMKKGNFNKGDEFLCNTTAWAENRLVEDSKMHPCDKNLEDFLLNSPKVSDPYEYESTLNRETELNPLVVSDNEVLNDSIIEPDLEGRNSKSKTEKSNLERPLKYMNDSMENPESDFLENPFPSLSKNPLEKALGNFFSREEKESGLLDGPVADGRILTKHHASHKRNQPVKETFESAGTHDSKKKVSRIDQLVINQQSRVTKTIMSKGGNKKRSERGRKSDDTSMSNVGPKTFISSETTLNVPQKDADVTVITAVKEHESNGKDGYNFSVDNMKGKVSDARGISHEKSDITSKNPLDSNLVNSGKDETGTKAPQDRDFPIKDSKYASQTRKNKLDKSHVKQREVKLSRNERIPKSDRGYKSEIFENDPWNLRLDPVSGKDETDTNDYIDGNFPIVNSHVSRDVSHTRENQPEDEDRSIKDLSVQNEIKLSNIPKDNTKGDSHEKSEIHSEDPLNWGFDYDSENSDGADINAHIDGHIPFVDSKGSIDVSHTRKDKPAKSSFHKEAQLPYNEQVPEDDKATTSTLLEPTQESLSKSLKVLFFNQSLYQEVIHLVKTDRNVQAYVFNVLLLYVPVLICDVLLWLVIFKLLRHIHRQFVSNRLNSAPSTTEKQEAETKVDSAPGAPEGHDKDARDEKNAESNAQTEGTWYPPKSANLAN